MWRDCRTNAMVTAPLNYNYFVAVPVIKIPSFVSTKNCILTRPNCIRIKNAFRWHRFGKISFFPCTGKLFSIRFFPSFLSTCLSNVCFFSSQKPHTSFYCFINTTWVFLNEQFFFASLTVITGNEVGLGFCNECMKRVLTVVLELLVKYSQTSIWDLERDRNVYVRITFQAVLSSLSFVKKFFKLKVIYSS